MTKTKDDKPSTTHRRISQTKSVTKKPVGLTRLGWLFVFLWPPAWIVLLKYSVVMYYIHTLGLHSDSLMTESLILIPPALVALPLVFRLDLSRLSVSSNSKISAAEQVVTKVMFFGVLMVILYMICLYTSITLDVNTPSR